jgi:hypothetical protein
MIQEVLSPDKLPALYTIRSYLGQLEKEVKTLEEGPVARCNKMLEQAFSSSQNADVAFVFEGRHEGVRGHRAMLSAGSDEFDGMFRSGMIEAQEGRIQVPPCVGVQSFRGFLEWVYLGECAPR